MGRLADQRTRLTQVEKKEQISLTHAIEDGLDHASVNLFPVSMGLDLFQYRRDETIVVVLDHGKEEMLLPLYQSKLQQMPYSQRSWSGPHSVPLLHVCLPCKLGKSPFGPRPSLA
jgi:hypothetical protein